MAELSYEEAATNVERLAQGASPILTASIELILTLAEIGYELAEEYGMDGPDE